MNANRDGEECKESQGRVCDIRRKASHMQVLFWQEVQPRECRCNTLQKLPRCCMQDYRYESIRIRHRLRGAPPVNISRGHGGPGQKSRRLSTTNGTLKQSAKRWNSPSATIYKVNRFPSFTLPDKFESRPLGTSQTVLNSRKCSLARAGKGSALLKRLLLMRTRMCACEFQPLSNPLWEALSGRKVIKAILVVKFTPI